MAKLISTTQLAERLGVSHDAIYRWVRSGRIKPVPCFKTKFLFDPEAVEAALSQPAGDWPPAGTPQLSAAAA